MESQITIQQVKAWAKAAYPTYKGRKFKIAHTEGYQMEDYWADGSRCYAVAIELATGRTLHPTRLANYPFATEAHIRVEIPPAWGILERHVFCGKEVGITLYLNAPLAIQPTTMEVR